MDKNVKAEYGPITTRKITRNIYQAKTTVTRPVKMETTMSGRTADIAKQKLELFLANKPYKHLDDM